MIKPYNIGNIGSGVTILTRPHKKDFIIGQGSTYNDCCWFNAKGGIEIGENTLIGPYVMIISVNHIIKNIDIEQNANDDKSWCYNKSRIKGEKVIIGNDVWIGAGVIILPGAIIPDKCVIGAGTIVTKNQSKKLKIGDIVVNDTKLRVVGNRENYE